MDVTLITLVIGFFVALLILNIYFRVKVLKAYKVLVRNKVEFDASHMFNRQKLQDEVIVKYPKFEKEILDFNNHIRNSIMIAVGLVLLIAIAGGVLSYFR